MTEEQKFAVNQLVDEVRKPGVYIAEGTLQELAPLLLELLEYRAAARYMPTQFDADNAHKPLY